MLMARRKEDEGTIAPPDERWKRGEVEQVEQAIADEEGRPSQPYRARDTLTQLLRAKAITGEMLQAGVQFRDDFDRAGLEPLRAADVGRIPGTATGPRLTYAQIDARERVWKAIVVLGGLASPAGACCWHILGLQESLEQWALREGWRGKPMDKRRAGGILIGALGTLAAHYGLEPAGQPK